MLPLASAVVWSAQARASEVEVKALNRGPGGTFFVFSPEVVRLGAGDTVTFVAADKGHDVYTLPGMIPEGAQPFDGGMSQDIKVTFMVPGVYVVACRPHMPLGMLALIVVGAPVNLDKIDAGTLAGKARSKLESLLASLK